MLEWFVYVLIIAFFFVLMYTGWIVVIFPLYLVFLGVGLIAEMILVYQKYKYLNKKENDK